MANVAEPNAGSTAPHGSNTPADGKEEAGAPSKPFYRRILENYLSSTQTKDKPSETPAENVTTASNATNPAEAVFPLTQEKIAKMQRELLDAAYYAEIDAEAEKAIKDPSRKLIWNPNITPEDGKWLEQREKFRALLVNNSVANILESEFEDAQKLLLIPPPENGPMLQIQLENAREYKAVFKPGARFHGVADNLATKLTMLKFGLPVEAVTLKNVERCDNTLDEDDPQDGPEDTPAVQRIMYAEMPLEFLDLYSERSFGYPMLRMPKRDHQQQPIILPGNDTRESNKPDSAQLNQHHHNHARPIFPISSKLHMRGGAGSSEELFLNIPRYLYGNDDDMSLVNYDKCSSFIDALFTLFSQEAYTGDSRTAWFFHIDVYQNHDKSRTRKKFQRTVDIDQANIQERWSGTLRHLLFNYEHEWILRAQIARPRDKLDAPLIFELPTLGTKLGSKPYVHWEEVKNKNESKKTTPKQQNLPDSGPPGSKFSQPGKIWPNKADVHEMTVNCSKATTKGPRDHKLFNVESKKLSKPAATKDGAKSTVYGYRGHLEIDNTRESFLRAALLLTGQHTANTTNPTWAFDVDVPGKDPSNKLSASVIPANWQKMFSNIVLPNLKADQPWSLFVRRGGRVSTEFQPSKSTRNIVRITLEGRGTAYWKVPSDMRILDNCGINQIQPDFVRAMNLLCHDEPRRKDKLHVGGFSLGSDGLECVNSSLWELIKNDVSKHVPPLEYGITFRPIKSSLGDKSRTNIQMVGNNAVSAVRYGDYKELAREIREMSVGCLGDSKLPPSFRIWENSQAREQKKHSAVVKYGTIEHMCEGLKKCSVCWPRSHTLWFRAEWETFSLQDIDVSENTTEWDSRADQSLHSFKIALRKLWSDPVTYDSFCITEVPSISGRGIRFIVTKDTTEDDWRLYVFDWLHTQRLAVSRNTKVDYVLDTTSEWGHSPSVQQPIPIPAGTPLNPKPSTNKKTMPAKSTGPVPVGDTANPLGSLGFGNVASPDYATAPTHPEFNRSRIVKPRAAKAKTPKYATWLANEDYQDGLKQQSYIKDQKVVIPGKLPAAPVYGPSRELQIKVSSHLPTVYVQRITPSDINELIDENQTLRNKVLERMWACPTCNITFKNYNNTAIREHMQEHIQQVQEAAECPMCGNVNWAFMSMNQKRDHFQWHMAKENTIVVQEQWRDIRCPACNKNLSNMQPEAIVDHCLKHRSDIVQYCDKCGLHEAVCTKEELAHHQQVCRQAPERRKGEPIPAFCEFCGKDTSNQTQIQNVLHERDCQNKLIGPSKTFCTKCGLNITTFNNMQLAGHTSRCAVPRGIKRKFCGRCSTDLSELDNAKLSHHQHQCQFSELVTPPSDGGQPPVSKKRKTAGQTQDAHVAFRQKSYTKGIFKIDPNLKPLTQHQITSALKPNENGQKETSKQQDGNEMLETMATKMNSKKVPSLVFAADALDNSTEEDELAPEQPAKAASKKRKQGDNEKEMGAPKIGNKSAATFANKKQKKEPVPKAVQDEALPSRRVTRSSPGTPAPHQPN